MLDDGAGNITTSALLGGGAWDDGGEGGGIPSPPPPPMVYAIRSGDHRIGSFVLHKPEFCAGDIVLGIFDFSSASTRCLQARDTRRLPPFAGSGKGRTEWSGARPFADISHVVIFLCMLDFD